MYLSHQDRRDLATLRRYRAARVRRMLLAAVTGTLGATGFVAFLLALAML